MFYDERINAECGKIYRRGIAYATGMTLIYTILRGLYLFSIHQLKAVYLITELAILLCGAVILITGAIRFAGERDERTAWEKHNYYLKAGKIFLIVTLSGFAASLPFASEKEFSDFPTNHLILVLEVLRFCTSSTASRRAISILTTPSLQKTIEPIISRSFPTWDFSRGSYFLPTPPRQAWTF